MQNSMKSLLLLVSIVFGTTFTSVRQGHAQDVPHTISYQGVLQASNSAPANGIEPMTIRLYSDSAGTQLVWEDVFTPNIQNGVFNVMLGSQKPLPNAIQMNVPLWLAVKVGENAEMKPYAPLSASPYSLNAASANALAPGAKGAITSINGKTGDFTLKAGTGTSIEADGNTITISAVSGSNSKGGKDPFSVAQSVAGTNHQVYVDGTYGVQEVNDVVLTLSQNIDTASTPQFANINLNNIPSGSSYTNVLVSNGGVLQTRTISSLSSGVTSIHGTANQVVTSDTTGSVTLSLPQNINTGATPQFADVTLASMPSSSTSTNVVVSNSGSLETRSFASLTSPSWSLTGNAGTTPGTNFVGTTDNQALYFDVNGSPNLILNTNYSIQKDVNGNARGSSAIDLQSRRDGPTEIASGNYSVIAGGLDNTASGDHATVAGGQNNYAIGIGSMVGGGQSNQAMSIEDGVAGGLQNTASGGLSTVSGGTFNSASGWGSVIGGGTGNQANSFLSVIAGGANNIAIGASFVGGGVSNHIVEFGNASVIGGGENNTIHANADVFLGGGNNNLCEGGAIVGGIGNHTFGPSSFIGAGDSNAAGFDAGRYYCGIVAGRHNAAIAQSAFIGGGENNTANGNFAAIAGGLNNTAYANNSFVGGGETDTANGDHTVVAGGFHNVASHAYATIGGGEGNVASGNEATVAGGASNVAQGSYSVVGGGGGNVATQDDGVVAGGWFNLDSATNSVISGGQSNIIFSGANTNASVIAGGVQNQIYQGSSFIGSGYQNRAYGGYDDIVGGQWNVSGNAQGNGYSYHFIGGGSRDTISTGDFSIIVGGLHNIVGSHAAFIGGGVSNSVSGYAAVIVGGDSNTVDGNVSNAFIGGGHKNFAGAHYSAISGGSNNIADNYCAVGGGANNYAGGDYGAIPGGYGLTLFGNGSFGFLGGNTGSNNMTISAANTSVLGNTDLWLANNDGTARGLYFYSPNSTTGVFPGSTTYTSFKAQSQSANITYALPASQGAANTVMSNDGSGVLSWTTPRKNWVSVPSSSSASGTAGDEAYDSNYLYVCVSSNSWMRIAKDTSSW
jgi:hypothetical protein